MWIENKAMQISSANPSSRLNDPAWYFLAEILLSEFLPDHDRRDERTAGLLFQTVRELGIPPECVENIETALLEFAEGAPVHFKQGGLESRGQIRIFCQKKMIRNASSERPTLIPDCAEQALEHARRIFDFGAQMNGGWGYFLIKRGGNVSTGSSVSSWNSVDLYLYKEGE